MTSTSPAEEWLNVRERWDLPNDSDAHIAFLAGCLSGMENLKSLPPDELREVRHLIGNDLQRAYALAMSERRKRHA